MTAEKDLLFCSTHCYFICTDLIEKLTEENKELQLRFLEQKQQLEEIKDRMKFFTKVNGLVKNYTINLPQNKHFLTI